tara:strand:+ start:1661 stop:2041 length:381 start_codon:yes stop_codon:yes gene_type:complete
MKTINTDNAPKAIGPYSQAVKHNNFMFTSGQIPLDPDTGLIVSQNFKEQVYQCLKNIQGILEEENLSLTAIIKLTVYVIDLNNFSKLNEVFEDFFIDFYPARSAVEVSRLPKDSQVEIEAICSYEN